MEFMIIGGEPQLIGQTGDVINSLSYERADGTQCTVVQLSCAPVKNGLMLFFLPEHIMPLKGDESLVDEDELVNM